MRQSVGMLTVPAVGFCIPHRIFNMVDLPAPFFPTRANPVAIVDDETGIIKQRLDAKNSTFSPSTDTIAAYFL